MVMTGPGWTVTTLPPTPKSCELLLQDPRVHDQALAIVGARVLGRLLEDRHVGELIGTGAPGGLEAEGLLGLLGTARRVGVVDDFGSGAPRLGPRRGLVGVGLQQQRDLLHGLALLAGPLEPRVAGPLLAPHAEGGPAALEAESELGDPGPQAGHEPGGALKQGEEAARARAEEPGQSTAEQPDGPTGGESRRDQPPDGEQGGVEEQRPRGAEQPALLLREVVAEQSELPPRRPGPETGFEWRAGDQGGDRGGRGHEQSRADPEARGESRQATPRQEPHAEHRARGHQQNGPIADAAQQRCRGGGTSDAPGVGDQLAREGRVEGVVGGQRERGEARERDERETGRLLQEHAARRLVLFPPPAPSTRPGAGLRGSPRHRFSSPPHGSERP